MMKKLLLLLFAGLLISGQSLFAQATDLFFSEYIEGSSNNKALEIYNGTGADVDLSAYSVNRANNGGDWEAEPFALSGTLSDGDVFVIYNSSAVQAIVDEGDVTSTVTYFNGDDAVGLFKSDVLIDVIGVQGEDPGSAWDVAGVTEATGEHTLVRKESVTGGNTDWSASAGTDAASSEWEVFDQDEFSYIGAHVMSTGPSSETMILSFEVPGQQGMTSIDAENFVVDFDVVKGTDLTALVPTIEVSAGATIDPASGDAQDFSDTVEYTVTAEDETTTQVWKAVGHIVSEQTVIFEDDFEDGTLDKWLNIAVVSDTSWTIDETHGLDDTKCAKATGYNGGATDTELWLIADSLDFSMAANKVLSFYTAMNYGGPGLEVKYSTDYAAEGAPGDATWTDVTSAILSSGNWNWTNSGEIDLSDIEGDNVSIAFVYKSDTDNGAATWEIDNVSITGTDELSSDAEVLTFSFEEDVEVETAEINSEAATITSTVAWDADVTALTPVFSVSVGAQVTPTTTDFTNPVVFTVAAQDGVTTKDWTVTVNKQEGPAEVTINEIQNTDDASGDSPYVDKMVKTSGIVTATNDNGFFLQDGAGAWNGVWVYSPDSVSLLAVGDDVTITGMVDEYYNLTEILDLTEVVVNSNGNDLPALETVALADFTEAYEGVLVKVENVFCSLEADEYMVWAISNANEDTVRVDDDLFEYTPTLGEEYASISGVGTYTYGYYKILPRDASDIITTSITTEELANVSVYPNPVNSVLTVKNLDGVQEVVLSNVLGQTMFTKAVTNNKMKINTSDLKTGIYIVTIVTENGLKRSERIVKQ